MANTTKTVVRTDVVAIQNLNAHLAERLDDDWELIYMDFVGHRGSVKAAMLMVFKKKT